MLSLRKTLSTLTCLLLSVPANTQVLDALSFGHGHTISPDGRTIPNWQIQSVNHNLQIHSDRVVLTPPAPGHARGGLWATQPVNHADWSATLDFRASGPERGSGNLQIWFARDTAPASGLKSVYTVEAFDGLALVVDQYGSMGGQLRGFLNDGSVNFKNHHDVDSLAFGHCDFSYRNLGKMSKLVVSQSREGLEVTVDGKSCFKSNLIRLPVGYYFGVSAATGEVPDSFELQHFVVSSVELYRNPPPATQYSPPPPPAQQGGQYQQPPPPASGGGGLSEANYNEIINHLNAIHAASDYASREIGALSNLQMNRHAEIKRQTSWGSQAQFDAIDQRIQGLEQKLLRLQRDLEGADYQASLKDLKNSLKDTQANLMNSLPASMSDIVTSSAPKMSLFIFVVVIVQIALMGAYQLYKKRLANSPKKFLRGHVSHGHGRVGKHRKHPGGKGMAGGQHHHRTNLDKYHPGYFGKVGMRHFHMLRNHYWKPGVNIDKLWTLVPPETRTKYLSSSSMSTDTAPVLDMLQLGYAKVLGKGRLPEGKPLIVKARYFSREAERKIKEAGGAVELVA
ncbi:MAG: hypothetical protein M1831_005333 [Alyxoria varia]|nr:MAG: hypothetical protein M1831_005333 [Alyxoria varia]